MMPQELVLNAAELDNRNSNLVAMSATEQVVDNTSNSPTTTMTATSNTITVNNNVINGDMQSDGDNVQQRDAESSQAGSSTNEAIMEDTINNNDETTLILSIDGQADGTTLVNTISSPVDGDRESEEMATCDLMVRLVENNLDEVQVSPSESNSSADSSASSSSSSSPTSTSETKIYFTKSNSPLPSSSSSASQLDYSKWRQQYRQQQQQKQFSSSQRSYGSDNITSSSSSSSSNNNSSISFVSRHSIRSIAQSVEQFLNPLKNNIRNVGNNQPSTGFNSFNSAAAGGSSLAVTKSFRTNGSDNSPSSCSRQSAMARSRTSPVYFSSFHMKWFQGQEELTTTVANATDVGLDDIEMDYSWTNGSEEDDDDEESEEDQNEKKRLRLEDFMRQIVAQLNESADKKSKTQGADNEKVWFDLLLDFTRNFAEYQVPYNRFVNDENNLIGDILDIALRATKAELVQRRVLGCHLLLNIHELLSPEMIRTRVVGELCKLLEQEKSAPVRFNLCFTLAHLVRRLDFEYFTSDVFPYFKQLVASIDLDQQQHKAAGGSPNASSTMAITFAALDALIFLLPHITQLNQGLATTSDDYKLATSTSYTLPSMTSSTPPEQLYSFIEQQYLPLLKHLFELMIYFIQDHKQQVASAKQQRGQATDSTGEAAAAASGATIKIGQELVDKFLQWKDSNGTQAAAPVGKTTKIDQEMVDCFLQWKDANRAQDSITQTIYLHYHSLLFFMLLVRENRKKIVRSEPATTDGDSSSEPKSTFDQDRWYMEYFDKLCCFLYSKEDAKDDDHQKNGDNLTKPVGAFNIFSNSNDHLVSSSNHLGAEVSVDPIDVFGFFGYKVSLCKSHLISAIPILFDLYNVTRTTHDECLPITKAAAMITDSEAMEEMSEGEDDEHQQQQRPEEFIIEKLISTLNSIVIDMDGEIVMKLLYVFEKLIVRLDNPLRFYMFMVHVCRSDDNRILSHLLNSFLDILAAMVRQDCRRKRKMSGVGCPEEVYNSQIEAIVTAFLNVEQLLSSKPNWRIYMQYLNILLKTTRQVPLQITKQVIVPRLMERLYTLRHITSRQAIIRFLMIVYLENFVHADMLFALRLPGVSQSGGSQTSMARLDVGLYEWAEANLYKANKYQLRQTYIDLVAILASFLGSGDGTGPKGKANTANYYMADLLEQCPVLYELDAKQMAAKVVDKRIQLEIASSSPTSYSCLLCLAVTIRRNALLKRLAEMVTDDPVATIRASAATCLWWLMKYYKKFIVECGNYWKATLYEGQQSNSTPVADLVDYFVAFLIRLKADLAPMVAKERDRLTSIEVKRLGLLLAECHREIEGWMHGEIDLMASGGDDQQDEEEEVVVHPSFPITLVDAMEQQQQQQQQLMMMNSPEDNKKDEDEDMDDVTILVNDILTAVEAELESSEEDEEDDDEEDDEFYDDEDDELFIDEQHQVPLIVADPPPSVVAEFEVTEGGAAGGVNNGEGSVNDLEDYSTKMETCTLYDHQLNGGHEPNAQSDDQEMTDMSAQSMSSKQLSTTVAIESPELARNDEKMEMTFDGSNSSHLESKVSMNSSPPLLPDPPKALMMTTATSPSSFSAFSFSQTYNANRKKKKRLFAPPPTQPSSNSLLGFGPSGQLQQPLLQHHSNHRPYHQQNGRGGYNHHGFHPQGQAPGGGNVSFIPHSSGFQPQPRPMLHKPVTAGYYPQQAPPPQQHSAGHRHNRNSAPSLMGNKKNNNTFLPMPKQFHPQQQQQQQQQQQLQQHMFSQQQKQPKKPPLLPTPPTPPILGGGNYCHQASNSKLPVMFKQQQPQQQQQQSMPGYQLHPPGLIRVASGPPPARVAKLSSNVRNSTPTPSGMPLSASLTPPSNQPPGPPATSMFLKKIINTSGNINNSTLT